MKLQNEEERRVAAQTLKEVMEKLEEALRLARRREGETCRPEAGAGRA